MSVLRYRLVGAISTRRCVCVLRGKLRDYRCKGGDVSGFTEYLEAPFELLVSETAPRSVCKLHVTSPSFFAQGAVLRPLVLSPAHQFPGYYRQLAHPSAGTTSPWDFPLSIASRRLDLTQLGSLVYDCSADLWRRLSNFNGVRADI